MPMSATVCGTRCSAAVRCRAAAATVRRHNESVIVSKVGVELIGEHGEIGEDLAVGGLDKHPGKRSRGWLCASTSGHKRKGVPFPDGKGTPFGGEHLSQFAERGLRVHGRHVPWEMMSQVDAAGPSRSVAD